MGTKVQSFDSKFCSLFNTVRVVMSFIRDNVWKNSRVLVIIIYSPTHFPPNWLTIRFPWEFVLLKTHFRWFWWSARMEKNLLGHILRKPTDWWCQYPVDCAFHPWGFPTAYLQVVKSYSLYRKTSWRGSLVGCRLWGRTESDTAEATQQQQQQHANRNCYLYLHTFYF